MAEVTKYPVHKQAVEDFLKEFKYGDLVGHDWLEARFGMPSMSDSKALTVEQFRDRQFEWLANVEAFKAELLRDHQVCLQSVRGRGYRWVRLMNRPASRWMSWGATSVRSSAAPGRSFGIYGSPS